jgi:hypothetical protein
VQVAKVARLRARSERVFTVAEEVLADLRVAQRFHVVFGAVDAAAGLVEADYGDGLRGVTVGEFASEVGVEAFGAEGDEDVYYDLVSLGSVGG